MLTAFVTILSTSLIWGILAASLFMIISILIDLKKTTARINQMTNKKLEL